MKINLGNLFSYFGAVITTTGMVYEEIPLVIAGLIIGLVSMAPMFDKVKVKWSKIK